MRHRKHKFQISRFSSLRLSTIKSLVRATLIHQKIITTRIKAKATRSLLDKLISLGKDDSLASRRKAFSILLNHRLVKKLFTEIAPRFKTRPGGYSRIINLDFRRGDNANLVILELTEQKIKEVQKKLKKEAPPQQEKTIEEKLEPEEKSPFKKETSKAKKLEPPKKFLGGLRRFFKKERDSL
jgi:large subunit ribosomal protein L17